MTETPVAKGIYDPFTHTCADDPYSLYRELRDTYPVYRNTERDCWVLSRHDDVQAAARDWQTFSNAHGVDLDLPAQFLGVGDFISADPPSHDRLRKIVRDAFAPKRLCLMESEMRTRVETLTEAMVERGVGDLGTELALPLPMVTVLDLLGFPGDDEEMLRGWLGEEAKRIAGSEDTPGVASEARDKLDGYILQLVDGARRRSRDDVMSVITHAVARGEMIREEVVGLCLLLLVAGWETTAGLISSAFYNLERHPDQRAILAREPEAIPRGVEELLRYDAPVQHLMRITTREVELHDQVIPAGERVLLLWGSANRDERRWEDPDRLNVGRDPKRHIAFGEGIHHCLGAPLARLEAKVALETILSRAPAYEITGPVRRFSSHVVRGLESLPVTFP